MKHQEEAGDWPFQDQPDTWVLTTRDIVENGAWIQNVFHDHETGWQFNSIIEDDMPDEDVLVVSLQSIVELDQSVLEVADLEFGWCAWRESKDGPWKRQLDLS